MYSYKSIKSMIKANSEPKYQESMDLKKNQHLSLYEKSQLQNDVVGLLSNVR